MHRPEIQFPVIQNMEKNSGYNLNLRKCKQPVLNIRGHNKCILHDNFFFQIGLAGALGIGGLIAGFALIQQAAIAREQIRSQINADTAVAATINTLLPTQTAAITSLTASQTLATNQLTPLCATSAAVLAAIPATIPTGSAAAVLEPIINALITALMSNPCP